MVVDLNATDASVKEIAEAASDASDKDLSRARGDPSFQFVSDLLVPLPLLVSAPDFEEALADLRGSSDVGEMAKVSFLECLSVQLHDKLPSLFEPTPQEMRKALVKFASGDTFAKLARDFFARLTYRSLDHYLCRELANHIAEDRRFATDA